MRVQVTGVEVVGSIQVRTAQEREQGFDLERFLRTNRHARDYPRLDAEARENLHAKLERGPSALLEAGELELAARFLCDFDVLAARLALEPDARALLDDLRRAGEQLGDRPEAADVGTVRRALRLAAAVLPFARDQFPEQVLARLGAVQDGRIGRLCRRAAEYKGDPWLRPVTASLEGPDSPLEGVVAYQDQLILAACIDPRGRLLTVGDDWLVCWEPDSPRGPVRYRVGEGSPTALAGDGHLACVSTREGPTLVFDLAAGRRRDPLRPDGKGATLGATFLADGRLATAGTDGRVRLWDVRAAREVDRLELGELRLHSLLALGDGRLVVGTDPVGDARHAIQIWDVPSRARRAAFARHDWPVDHLATDAGGTTLVAAANDELSAWRLADLGCVRRLVTRHTKTHALAHLPPDLVLAADAGGELRLFRLGDGAEIRRLPSHAGLVSAVAPDLPRRRLVTTSWDQTVRIWDLDRLLRPQPPRHREEVTALALTADEARLVSGSQDGSVLVWDARGGAPPARLGGHEHWVSAVFAAPSGVVISAGWDGTVRLWDLAAGRLRRTLPTGDRHVSAMACSADGARAVTVATDGMTRVWDLAGGAQLAAVRSPDPDVRAVALEGATVRWGTSRRRIFTWPVGGEPTAIDLPGQAPATRYDLTARGGWLLAGLADGALRLFGGATPPAAFGVPGCGPGALARSAAGDLILAAGGLPQMASDNTARVWRTADPRAPLAAFVGDLPFTAAAMSGDGRRVYLGDASGAVHFLELAGT